MWRYVAYDNRESLVENEQDSREAKYRESHKAKPIL